MPDGDPNDRAHRGRVRMLAVLAIGLAIVAVCAVGALALLAGPAVAGDAVALFEFTEPAQSASAGETVEIEVWLRSDGGYAGEGLVSYEFVLAVPPEVGEPVEAEAGPWLAQGEGEVEQTVEDAGPGALRVRHERVGAERGVTGWDRAATVTVEVAEDAPAANATVLIADPDSELGQGDFEMRNFGDDATLVVDGGGETLEPAYDPAEEADDDGGVPVTTAEDVNRTVETDGGEDGDGEASAGAAGRGENESTAGGDALVGFGLGAALLALLGGVAVARR